MSRLIDRMNVYALKNKGVPLQGVPVIDITNTYQYVMSDAMPEELDPRTLPNPIAPFVTCWVEFDTGFGHFGIGVRREELTPGLLAGLIRDAQHLPGSKMADFKPMLEQAETVQLLDVYTEWHKWDPPINFGVITVPVSAEHRVLGRSAHVTESFLARGEARGMMSRTDPNVQDRLAAFADLVTFNVHFAFSMMNAKNVALETHEPPAAVARKFYKKHRVSLTVYKTLDVHPARSSVRRDSAGEPPDRHVRLHIARGHFKDFSDGKGLFGKFKGIYWWEQQVRGSKEEGEVVKDYRVHQV